MTESVVAFIQPIFTPLHRWLGRDPEPLTLELVDAAITEGLEEKADLDFKLKPPEAGSLMQSDMAKDIAAMSNSGGGMLLFGVQDTESRATDAPGVSSEFVKDSYLRDLRRVAINRISPPVLGLEVLTFGDESRQGIAVLIPATEDAPHLVFNQDSFRAPYRNGPDTAWMNERMIEAAYRARFDARRSVTSSLHELMEGAIAGRPLAERAWMVAVAHPVNPLIRPTRAERSVAAQIFEAAFLDSCRWVKSQVHPLDWLDRANPRPGLRRWRACFGRLGDTTKWREAQAEICDDGSITVASAMGAGRAGTNTVLEGNEIAADRAETFVADFLALLWSSARVLGTTVFDVQIDIRLEGLGPIILRIPDSTLHGYYLDPEHSAPVHRFLPVRATLDTNCSEAAFVDHLREIALDVVNQGGAQYLHSIMNPTDHSG